MLCEVDNIWHIYYSKTHTDWSNSFEKVQLGLELILVKRLNFVQPMHVSA